METGDILLFQSNFSGIFGWWGWLISKITRSQWTHVAIVLKNPLFLNKSYTGLYVLESGSEPWADNWGVMISPLDQILDQILETKFYKKIVTRKLFWNIKTHDMEIVYNTIKDKKYDTNIIDLIGNEFENKLLADPKQANKFICSSLVAYIYSALDIFSNETKWFYYQPWHFSEQNKNLIFKNGHLGPEENINLCN